MVVNILKNLQTCRHKIIFVTLLFFFCVKPSSALHLLLKNTKFSVKFVLRSQQNTHTSQINNAQSFSSRSVSSLNASDGKDTDIDESFARIIAGETLVKVFFSVNENGELENGQQIIDTEKALKKSLRKLNSRQQGLFSLDEKNHSAMNLSLLRKRVSELVLGTSVMRLKYWFSALRNKGENEQRLMLEYPIHGAEEFASQLQYKPMNSISLESCQEKDTKELDIEQLTREMVDRHAEELFPQEHPKPKQQITCDDIKDYFGSLGNHKVPELTDEIRLSILLSLPLFLSKIFIQQYGYDTSVKLIQASNVPGPITLRRNHIRSATNEDLCTRLLHEDGIRATPIKWKNSPNRWISKNTNFAIF